MSHSYLVNKGGAASLGVSIIVLGFQWRYIDLLKMFEQLKLCVLCGGKQRFFYKAILKANYTRERVDMLSIKLVSIMKSCCLHSFSEVLSEVEQ